ncbi:hypothetical protein CARUB_v10006598mg, partial [Capsella rubella]
PLHLVVQPEVLVVQAARLMDLIGDTVGDGVQLQEVVMAMVLVLVRHQKEEEKGVDSGLVRVRTVVLAKEVGLVTLAKVVAQAVGMVVDHQVVERGANTVKRSFLDILP